MTDNHSGGPGIRITVNGEPREFPAGITGIALIEQLGIPPSTTVAELNGQHVPRSLFHPQVLEDGDVVELVSLVGGG
jgi:sulfur carrier protein